jgi:hypothetical protein
MTNLYRSSRGYLIVDSSQARVVMCQTCPVKLDEEPGLVLCPAKCTCDEEM